MQAQLKWIIALLQLLIITLTSAENSQPYCYKNVTETSYKTVTKTRIKNVISKNFFKKMLSKKDTQIEVYEDQEPVFKTKVQRVCCEGYKLSGYDLCEPQCLKGGCPINSKCVEPDVCECVKGYFSARSPHDGKHYCEPICEQPCPENSQCVRPNACACKMGYTIEDYNCKPHCESGCPYGGTCLAPNKCACPEGYKLAMGSCLPSCSLGEQCQNGECIANDYCVCNPEFNWNNETLKCQRNYMPTSTLNPDFEETQESTKSPMEVETDIETFKEDIDPNQVFEEIFVTTTSVYENALSSDVSPKLSHKCEDDYVFHEGQCRPLKFVSDEVDCWQKPCQDENAECLGSGKCACKDGFKMLKTPLSNEKSDNHTIMAVCLTAAEYESRLQKLNENPNKSVINEHMNVTSIFFVALGVLVLTCALLFLGIKLFRRQTGELDVEGKNLSCAYSNHACCDPEKTAI